MSDSYNIHTVGNTSLVNYTDTPENAWDTYIGRESPRNGLPESPHHNPFRLRDYSRETSIELFTLYFYERIETQPMYQMQVEWLDGRTICCWCVPENCHGMVIQNWLNDSPVSQKTLTDFANTHQNTNLSPVSEKVVEIVTNAISRWKNN